jgi:hypothetical protein
MNPHVDLWILGQAAQEESLLSPIMISEKVEVGDQTQQHAYLLEAGDRGRHLATLSLENAMQKGEWMDPEGQRISERLRLERGLKLLEPFMKTNPFMRKRYEQKKLELSQLIKAQERERAQVHSPNSQDLQRRLTYQLIPITEKSPLHSQTLEWISAYHHDLKAGNDCKAHPLPPQPEPANGNGYAGQAECELCHVEAVQFWKKTRHASAWDTLVKADKTSDAGCVGCHVTGWQEPGGSNLCNHDSLHDVQCESCHGPAKKHAEFGGGEAYVKLKVPAETCQTCHNKLHSPQFDYSSYLKKVIGPGHGAPLTHSETESSQSSSPKP